MTSVDSTTALVLQMLKKMELQRQGGRRDDSKKVSSEFRAWTAWFRVRRALLSELGYADAKTEPEGQETNVNRSYVDRVNIDFEHLPKAKQAWVSLVTSCEAVAFDITTGEEPDRETWGKLVECHTQAV